MQTGLFFGSFNPIHIGHMAIAGYMTQFTELEEVWLVISPQNPLKQQDDMAPADMRYSWAEQAVHGIPRLAVSSVELHMPVPSYTIDTLHLLKEQFPDRGFSIVMGADGLETFSLWKNAEEIVKNYSRFIYPREDARIRRQDLVNCRLIDAPRMEVSSTFIRCSIREGKDMRFLLPGGISSNVHDYYLKH